jgi:tRNA(Ile)-lysidine synthase
MSIPLAQALQEFAPPLPLAVAYSGGADSTALLIACAQKWPGEVSAIHVNHGLQAAAAEFERHCRALCLQLNLPLFVCQVQALAAQGQSPEDAARRARYQAFANLSQSHPDNTALKNIAIAHHADDQVETLLLALSRGSGLPGFSAMPKRWQRNGISYHRPLLEVSGAVLRAWLTEQGQAFVTDPSNANQAYTRNRIRAQLLPVLESVFPHFRDTFARSAAHAAQGQNLLNQLAELDLASTGRPPKIEPLQLLDAPRQANALRHWLKVEHAIAPSTAQLHELVHQVAACTTRGHQIHIKVATGFVVRQGDQLDWYNAPLLP